MVKMENKMATGDSDGFIGIRVTHQKSMESWGASEGSQNLNPKPDSSSGFCTLRFED